MVGRFKNKIYAGVLGKLIGVYLGRPVEGWSYQKIRDTFDEVKYYVHDRVGVPLIVADDDISGTFGFFRALEDYGYDKNIPAKAFGDTWLNYIIENRTILWWGGLGRSTEHTAFLNLKNGIEAPMSGSMKINGKTLSEQIGAQIFIDGNKRVAQLIANKILIENDIGIFQIDIEDLETFKGLLLEFYESDDDTKIISFMQQHCVKRCAVSYDEM